MKYRSKQVEVEAILFDGNNFGEIGAWVAERGGNVVHQDGELKMWPHGTGISVTVRPGECVIFNQHERLGVKSAEVMEKHYEKVGDDK